MPVWEIRILTDSYNKNYKFSLSKCRHHGHHNSGFTDSVFNVVEHAKDDRGHRSRHGRGRFPRGNFHISVNLKQFSN